MSHDGDDDDDDDDDTDEKRVQSNPCGANSVTYKLRRCSVIGSFASSAAYADGWSTTASA